MCDPATAMAMQGAGAANSAIGAYYAAKGQKLSLKTEAAMADINARMSELSAKTALAAGQRQEQGSRLATAQLKGSQKAALAANGIDLSYAPPGSTVNNILTTTDTLGEIDANTIAANSIREAFGYRMEGTNYTNKAILSRAAAKAISPFKAVQDSLLTSASSIAMNRYQMQKVGAI